MSEYILAINPGSTSTKVAVFNGGEKLFSESISHDAKVLAEFPDLKSQLSYRKEMIDAFLQKSGFAPDSFAAVVGRGGGLLAVEGGVYEINDLVLRHAENCENGIVHPATLGVQLAVLYSKASHCPSFVVNPPDTDELQDVARMTGIKGVYRNVHLHALNLKETAIHHSALFGKKYEECNYIVCHIGGGISVSAHRMGKMVDGNDIVGGEGPLAPTRCGSIPAMELINYCFSGVSKAEAKALCTKTGGFVSHLGTSDAIEVTKMAESGDMKADMLWHTMIYQIIKEIGAMSAVLKGKVDGILLGGGMVHNKELVEEISEAVSYIAHVTAYPGEFEMEAMANGALRVLHGEEQPKTYTGLPVWDKRRFE